MKVMTLFGTRPEIIRLSRVIQRLDQCSDQSLVHTGQNYDPNLSDVFFHQLDVRSPDIHLGIRATDFAEQAGQILARSGEILARVRPERLLILGDTNSGLAAIIASRMGIPVYHMEAGNRCYDDRVPEEINRRIIDHSSDVLMPYTERSRQNLLREGIPGERIYVTGNPIYEVIRHYDPRIGQSTILADLGLASGNYFLVTMHRAENVDLKERLDSLTRALGMLHEQYGLPVVVSTHPRTKSRMEQYGLASQNPDLRFLPPFGFFDFITLERNAFCVLSDSGTVQEECAIFKVPNVTLRDVTERPETLECGSNILSGAVAETILQCVRTVTAAKADWQAPAEYLVQNVSETVTRLLLGYLHRQA
jgi:UDP-N-acetylglucosamine 2-epimerase (non-hydrolysing)